MDSQRGEGVWETQGVGQGRRAGKGSLGRPVSAGEGGLIPDTV